MVYKNIFKQPSVVVDGQSVSRVAVGDSTLLGEVRESLGLLVEELQEALSGTAHSRTIGTFLQELGVLVDQDTVVLASLVGVILEAEAVALEALDGDVGQEGHEIAALPDALGVDAV